MLYFAKNGLKFTIIIVNNRLLALKTKKQQHSNVPVVAILEMYHIQPLTR